MKPAKRLVKQPIEDCPCYILKPQAFVDELMLKGALRELLFAHISKALPTYYVECVHEF
jgi:hypothetical protein